MENKNIYRRLDSIVKMIIEKYNPNQIILFGSYANGKPDEQSDIDLLIVKQTSYKFHQRVVDVRRIISNLRKGLGIDILVLTPEELNSRIELGDQFLENIVKQGKLLYG